MGMPGETEGIDRRIKSEGAFSDIQACEDLLKSPSLNESGRVEILERLARLRLQCGDYRGARAALEELFQHGVRVDDRFLVGRCHLDLGTVHLRLGEEEQAERHYQAAIYIFTWEVNEPVWLARSYNNLGIVCKQRGHWDEALKFFDLAKWNLGDSEAPECTVAINLNRAILMRKIGKLNEAWDSCINGLTMALASGLDLAVCRYYLEGAIISILRADLQEAERLVGEGVRIAEVNGYKREIVIGMEVVGDIAALKGRHAQALELYKEALSLGRELAEESDLVAEVLRRIALVSLELGDIEEAREAASESVRVAEEVGDLWELGVGLRVLGEVYLRCEEVGLAWEAFVKAVETLGRISGHNYELGIAEWNLALLLKARSEFGNDRFASAREHLLKARSICSALGWGDKVRDIDLELWEIDRNLSLYVGNRNGRLPNYQASCVKTTFRGSGAAGCDNLLQYGIVTVDERIVGDVSRWGPSEMRVLIEGETGVGKELIARAMHAMSRRREGRLMVIDCGSLSESLSESELFGHARGSFTGADRSRVGLIEEADGGTLFLDEVGELSERMQVKLLRVLEEGCVRRVGSNEVRRVDFRVISATTRDLMREVESGRFRRDLYYRLRGVLIRVPSLRERPYDVRLLLEYYLGIFNDRYGKSVSLSEEVLERLMRYSWPGNVRELRNLVEALVVGGTGRVGLEEVECFLVPMNVGGSLKEVERDAVERALKAANGNKSRAARLLGVSRKTLYRKIG